MEALDQRLANPFDLAIVKHKYGTDDYVGAIMHPKYDKLVYVFYQPNPKRELGHTEFFGFSLMGSDIKRWYILKLTGEELEDYQWHTAVKCDECCQILVSLYRHDYQTCDCNKAMVDGGSQYIRCYKDNMIVKINTITLEVQDHG